MKKRGQLMSQPFFMLFAVIFGALVLIWGIYIIYDKLIPFSEDIQLTDTINDLQRIVDQYYYFNEGSSREYKINLPSRFNKICFYLHTPDELGYYNTDDLDINSNFIKARKNDNVFVFPVEEGSVFNIENVRPEGLKNPLCFKSGEKFVITSRNNYVGVSEI